MLIRALCVLLLLVTSPMTTWATTFCCHADDDCCGAESPTCPVLPDGSCSIAAAGHAVATVSPAPEQLPPLPASPFEFTATIPLIGSSLASSVPDPDPPRFLLHPPLRN